MRLSYPLLTLSRFLLPPAIIGTVYLFFFPFLTQCAFPLASRAQAACYQDRTPYVPSEEAPFRLLAFADPQLEGDTSLADFGLEDGPLVRLGKWREDGIGNVVGEIITGDVPRWLKGLRKKIDLWGNDRYLAHVYSYIKWWSQPTHTVVLGDLLGSQWIGDQEFQRRSQRFWKTVFKGEERVPKEVTDVSGRIEVLGKNKRWAKWMMTVAGNHDIGYAGDIDEHRIERFEDIYGSTNWEMRFRLNASSASSSPGQWSLSPSVLTATIPELRLVILNSMNLDEPALKPDLHQQSLDFLSSVISHEKSPKTATVILTHIPLHKEAGTCLDPPLFSYFPENQGGGIKEQNHLSKDISTSILSNLVDSSPEDGKQKRKANGKSKAIILNGHDHEGCDTYHYRSQNVGNDTWASTPYIQYHRAQNMTNGPALSLPGMREITVRSMMGSFGGNAGLLSAWFDQEAGEWKFEYAMCLFGVQHIWWGIYILDAVVLGCGIGGAILWLLEERAEDRQAQIRRHEAESKKKAH